MMTIKLGSMGKNIATGESGMIGQLQIQSGGNVHYYFEPARINPKTKLPVESYWVSSGQIDSKDFVERHDLPLAVLNTEVEDKVTGLKGMAVAVNAYYSGCVHVVIQPPGEKEDGSKVDQINLDIRRLKGKSVPQLSDEEEAADKKKKPSPGPNIPIRIIG